MKNIMDKVKGERKVRYQDLVLLAGAGGLIMDLKEGRIDNRWILLCLGCGLLSHTIRDGPAGLFSGFAGILTPFLLLYYGHRCPRYYRANFTCNFFVFLVAKGLD